MARRRKGHCEACGEPFTSTSSVLYAPSLHQHICVECVHKLNLLICEGCFRAYGELGEGCLCRACREEGE